jgi:hypothetical protein
VSVAGAEYVAGVAGPVSLVFVTTWSEASVILNAVMFPNESVEIVTFKAALPLPGMVLVSKKSETVDVMLSDVRLSNALPVNDVSNEIETS